MKLDKNEWQYIVNLLEEQVKWLYNDSLLEIEDKNGDLISYDAFIGKIQKGTKKFWYYDKEAKMSAIIYQKIYKEYKELKDV